ncbi:hypothetical protein Cni_G05489 [Canna indica]|uniref:VQ domain-containing protein n=1 Tax=Canna indica TaxID=4628 RepID=A0AAQ3JXA1_9LILI|nr:hypothetical protein Cni_G05489 [Canna indica]
MERVSSQRAKRSPKQAKADKGKKKQPVKVVYISNPTEVKASAAEFRSVVQELTGRASASASFSKHSTADMAAASSSTPPPLSPNFGVVDVEPREVINPGCVDVGGGNESPVGNFEEWGFDDVSEMLDGFPEFLPSPLYYYPHESY